MRSSNQKQKEVDDNAAGGCWDEEEMDLLLKELEDEAERGRNAQREWEMLVSEAAEPSVEVLRARLDAFLRYHKRPSLEVELCGISHDIPEQLQGENSEWYEPRISDPRLEGWGYPFPERIEVERGSKLTIESVKEHSAHNQFQSHATLEVNFAEKRTDGTTVSHLALFNRTKFADTYRLATLRKHLEEIIGEDILVHRSRLQEEIEKKYAAQEASDQDCSFDEILNRMNATIEGKEEKQDFGSQHMEEAFWRLSYHLAVMSDLAKVLAPLGPQAENLIALLNDEFERTCYIGRIVATGELARVYQDDALRGENVAKGSRIGANAFGSRAKAHAWAWKTKMGRWVEKDILGSHQRMKDYEKGISFDDLAGLVEAYWPEKANVGFMGLEGMDFQKATPKRPTLVKALKELERANIIKSRKSPPRGRKARAGNSIRG